MHLRTISIVVAGLMFVPGVVAGQEVDPSVNGIDPTVNSRVQDPDRPDSALLPGGSSAWTGQPIMSQTPSSSTSGPGQKAGAMSRSNQFPSLVGMSAWGPSLSGGSLSGTSTSSDASTAQDSRNAKGAQARASGWTAQSSLTRAGGSRRRNLTLANAEAQSKKSDRAEDELLVEQKKMSDAELTLRKVKQATARSARLRVTNPFQSKADASSAGRWGGDQSSARALANQQHETGMLLKSGFGARTTRRRKRAHSSSSSNATSR